MGSTLLARMSTRMEEVIMYDIWFSILGANASDRVQYLEELRTKYLVT